ncbi:MAG TPA: cytochrome c3 family protein [Pyrinomonadaceae bacterium]|nr:cytochrome c3 family protein [Pyrinomonadaceae bacterium]
MEREAQNQKAEAQAVAVARGIAAGGTADSRSKRRAAALALVVAFAAVFVSVAVRGLVAKADAVSAPPAGLNDASTAAAVAQGARRFSHAIRQHASVGCDSCHVRSADPHPHLPGHKACIECHATDFTTPGSPLCADCHTNVESNNPPLKAFPGLIDFGMRFDHATHMKGGAKPERGCSSCHVPIRRGAALNIIGGFTAHQSCYQCHSPTASAGGRSIATCSLCHALGSYSRPGVGAKAYTVGFSHAQHGARQGLSCEECHQVHAGAPQTRQVSSPQPTQHFGSARGASCMTCHNGRRTFGGDNFADCKKCHTGQTFKL